MGAALTGPQQTSHAVPEGYPDNPVKNKQLDISKVKNKDNLYYASVELKNNTLFGLGSRNVAIIGTGDAIWEAEEIAENEISKVKGPVFHRKDIGTTKLLQKKINNIWSNPRQ